MVNWLEQTWQCIVGFISYVKVKYMVTIQLREVKVICSIRNQKVIWAEMKEETLQLTPQKYKGS